MSINDLALSQRDGLGRIQPITLNLTLKKNVRMIHLATPEYVLLCNISHLKIL